MSAPLKPYKLRYLPLFWDDLNSAVTYMAQTLKNPAAAERLLDSTELAIHEHLSNPTMARVYHGKRDHKSTYYCFNVGNYMVFYVVDGDTVEMRRFIYGARDLTRMAL